MNPDIYAYLDKKAVELNGYFFRWNKESDEQTKAWLVLDIFQNTKSLFKTMIGFEKRERSPESNNERKNMLFSFIALCYSLRKYSFNSRVRVDDPEFSVDGARDESLMSMIRTSEELLRNSNDKA